MLEGKRPFSDQVIETVIGSMLRTAVILAALVIFLGGVVYLVRHGTDISDYGIFSGEPRSLRTVSGIMKDTVTFHSRGIIQLGLLFLVATPVLRVLFSVFAFAVQGDRLYVVVTLIVLATLIYSILGGHV